MAYTYDITDNIGKVRLLISDTDITPTTDAQFSDEELQAFLDLASGSLLTAAGFALEAWSASLTGSVLSEHIGDYSYTKKDAENKAKLGAEYKAEDARRPYMTWAEMDLTYGSGITVERD